MTEIGDRDSLAAIRPRWQYWPEIDGLRTIAVLSVFLFHFQRSVLPGGFVGVDIFFVISGFLIGSILLNDISKKSFSISRFYQRRVSRIFPALIVVILFTLIAGSFLYSAQDLASLGINSSAAALSVINLKLMSQGSYFTVSSDAQPLLHYWSLAVEEQFYIIFPLLLYFIMRYLRRPLLTMSALTALSFVICIWMTAFHPTVAFYSLPTRAWELLSGSSLALYRSEGGRVREPVAGYAAWAGLALIVISVAVLREQSGFPGWIAAIPVLGTVLLIASSGDAKPLPLRLLARQGMVAIGKRSYSLYLWHWPVFSFVDYRFFEAHDAFRGALKIAITLALTELSYRFVEKPARSYLNVRSRRPILFIGTLLLIGMIAAGGVWLRKSLYFDVPPRMIPSGGFVVSGGSNGTVILSGDSEAAMYGKEIASIARSRGFTLYAVGSAGSNELPGDLATHWPAVSKLIAEKKPDVLILVNAWADKLHDSKSLRQALVYSLDHARHVIVITQPPILADNVSRENIRNGLRPPYFEPADRRQQRLAANRIVASLKSDRVSVLDVSPTFIGPDGGIIVLAPDHRMAFVDAHHLSDSGTAMARGALEAAIAKGLTQPR